MTPTDSQVEPRTAEMRVVCAWCSKVMRDGPPQPVSHGICAACAGKSGLFPIESLHEMDAEALDALPWGTIVLDDQGIVLEYNTAEEVLARRSRGSTIGRSFFREVAPCTSVAEFGGLYAQVVATGNTQPQLFEFVFHFPGDDLLVEIAMSYAPTQHRGTLLIRALR
jgi:photoactive yellow protein